MVKYKRIVVKSENMFKILPKRKKYHKISLESIGKEINKMDKEILNEFDNSTKQTQKPNYENEIISIIRGSYSPKAMQDKLSDYHEYDIAEVMDKLTSDERKKLYRVLDIEMLSGTFEYIEEDEAAKYLDEMDMKKAITIISELETDSAVSILSELPREKRRHIIDLLDNDVKRQIELTASFDEDEIGSKMTANFVSIPDNYTVKQAMSSLIEQAAKNDNISTIFVTGDNNTFYGAIDLKDLIIARKEEPLENLISTSFPYVYANESIDSCLEKLKEYSENIIPVLDNGNHILGVLTLQSIIEVFDDELGEDYVKFAGLAAEEDLKEPLKESMKKRTPWLLVLLGLGMIVSTVVGAFESVVSKLSLIIAFQSLILGMAGNVGTQSLAVTIRVLMDQSITSKQKMKLVGKEVKVGFANGVIIGIISTIFVGLYILLFKGKTAEFSFAVSGCVGISLLVAMVISSAVGTLVPLTLKKLKVDPAVASGPLISTVNDLVAVLTYYGMSWLLLINVLHLAG